MELRLAVRRLLANPVASASIALAIALAMALCVALSSILDGLLFRPLPFTEADRLVAVDFRRAGGQIPELQYRPELADRRAALRDAIDVSPLVESASQGGAGSFFGPDDARQAGVVAYGVAADFFRVFGLTPHPGAPLTLDDERSPGALSRVSPDPLPIVIGQELWRRLYGGDHARLGVHQLAGRSVRIVGVMPPGVKFPGETNVWAPLQSTRNYPPAFVRLAADATIEQLAGAFRDLQFLPLRDVARPGGVRGITAIFIATLLLLFVTWVQVAAIMFSGTVGQLRDIGVRLALGARRGHLVRQFAIESAIVAAAALGLAWLAVGPLTTLIVGVLPAQLRHGQYLEPDGRTLLFAAVVSSAGIGLLTAVRLGAARRLGSLALLHRNTAGSILRAERVRFALLLGQQALTCALLYLYGLAIHSVVQATRFDVGFDSERVVVFTPPPWARPGASNSELMAAFAESNRKTGASRDLLRAVPGVVAASTFVRAPLGIGPSGGGGDGLAPIVRAGGQARDDLHARFNVVGADFVRAIGGTLVFGKSFDAAEFAARDDVVIVNETLARQLAPRFSVMGESLSPSVIGLPITAPMGRGMGNAVVIGIVKDFVDTKLGVEPAPQYFSPDRRLDPASMGLLIRLEPSVDVALPAVRGALERIWGPLDPIRFTLMRDQLDAALVPYRGQAALLVAIAVCCLPIAAVGLIGALSSLVAGRTREIGIRLSIGADPSDVQRLVIRRALVAVGLGALAGTGLGVAAGTVIASQLFQVKPVDATAWAGVLVVLLGLAWIAALVPARRASRVDPAQALRDS